MSTSNANFSTQSLWGQAWELTVYYSTSNASGDDQVHSAVISANSWGPPEPLRITFDVLQSTIPSPYWFADISIYNANAQTQLNVLFNATWVTLKAGFQTAAQLYSVIWDGPVMQVLFDRENVVDQRVILHCFANPLTQGQVVNFSMGAFATQNQMVKRMVQEVNNFGASSNQFQVNLSDLAEQTTTAVTYPRGNTVFGMPDKYLGQVADSGFMQKWLSGNAAYISELSSGKTVPMPDLIYSPPLPPDYAGPRPAPNVNTSIIGTPRQFPQGCIFQVLLDPRLGVQLPPLAVQLQRTFIGQTLITPGETYVSPWSSDLTFFVAQVRHSGDTRGNDWQTEVTAYTTVFASNLLQGNFSAVSG